MSQYNDRFTMQDFLSNPKLKNIFPQFGRGKPLQNVYSNAEIERRVMIYLQGYLGGRQIGDNELVVAGKHSDVLARTRQLRTTIETFFNSMPTLVKNLRSDTPLYTPFASISQLSKMKDVEQKFDAMQVILDNVMYNPAFRNNDASLKNSSDYRRRQEDWIKRVNWRER